MDSKGEIMSKLKDGLKQLKKRAYGIAHCETSLTETGGWKTIHNELRLIPLGVMKLRKRHCKSCSSFRKGGGYPYCMIHLESFMNEESESCEDYTNRTWSNH